MKLSQIAHILNAKFRGEDKDFTSTVSTDTRTIESENLFVALQGRHFDAHNFVKLALERGALGAIVSHWIEDTTSIPQICVQDTHRALIQLANYQRNRMKKVIIVAVTGSCGKTTTKELLANIFRKKSSNVLTGKKNFNNNIGLPLTLLNLRARHNYAVVEFGANHPGEISCLARITRPNIAIVTNAGFAHLEGFGSIKGVAQAKGEIYQELSLDQVAIINNDDPFSNFWREIAGIRRTITFACDSTADVTAQNITINPNGQSIFHLMLPNGETSVIQLSLLGRHNIMNALAAASAAYSQNFSIAAIKSGLENTCAVDGRMVCLKGYRGAIIIDDSYNANPSSVSVAIDVLSTFYGYRLILVLGDMRELGKDADRLHFNMGERALQSEIHELFCYGILTRRTSEAFGSPYYFDDQKKLLMVLKKRLDASTVVLVKGSCSMNMRNIVWELIKE
ncbi:UDP-N-acetylmuramoyl-tripeptide--D-alanyl-D-alanine ligase [Coxiella endosymbiont of Amblyomma sculptum]|uniref:UDP-N-acetylmuramoyl-tripeptide--D-alanyl-D- alanine ligase n=1 Tax=Coxiella endosymbiont of Amblyomma sculptum TaxID=2487929 RepID=UPI00132F1A4B|nr:UDP-N-acetylmuramoyl-tripeptide--D-alanyl-D-alanine ligase [Coxiella endosymbiont of Amblyomma sculptum]QHG92410.1 UDP-N-acetylmuramoyl-tripeptide--D-alanyl-D-alanine ligase [Coxiella endosymbiont of Amblyomma sculptum]